MIEGWHNDDYFILFESDESERIAQGYGIPESFPGYELVGLIGWDDFILAKPDGTRCRVPTVPLDHTEMTVFDGSIADSELIADEKLIGRIKWYIKPIVFGGDPGLGENVTWVDLDAHQQLVRWWNQKYVEIKRGTET